MIIQMNKISVGNYKFFVSRNLKDTSFSIFAHIGAISIFNKKNNAKIKKFVIETLICKNNCENIISCAALFWLYATKQHKIL